MSRTQSSRSRNSFVLSILGCALLLGAPTCDTREGPDPSALEPIRLHPSAISGYGDGASLVDRDAATGWTGDPGDELRVHLTLDGGPVAAVKVRTQGRVRMTALGKSSEFSGDGWHEIRHSITGGGDSSSIEVRVRALDGEAEVGEIEAWGVSTSPPSVEPSADVPAGTDPPADVDAFRIVAASPATATLTMASGSEATPPCASFDVGLDAAPGSFRRAFLRYTAHGVFRPLALSRSVNGSSMFRGRWVPSDNEARVVDPVDLERLGEGTNRFTFCLPSDASSARATVSDVELVLETDNGANLIEGAFVAPVGGVPTRSALDAFLEGSATITASEDVVIAFERLIRPDAVRLDVTGAATFTAQCVALDGSMSALSLAATVDARTTLTLEAAPATACAGLRIHPSSEVSLANVRVYGSGAHRRVDFPRITLASPREHFGLEAWVDGWANAPSDVAGGTRVVIETADAGTTDGRFGRLLERTGDESAPWPVTINGRFSDGSTFSRQFVLERASGSMPGSGSHGLTGSGDGLTPEERRARYGDVGATRTLSVRNGQAARISLGSRVYVDVPANAVQGTLDITMKHLAPSELPPLDPGLINVTAPSSDGGAHGYEFLPHGTTFEAPVAVTIPYEVARIPRGYTAADVETFYYDTTEHRWEKLARADVDTTSTTVRSLTDHFTTMIDAIVVAPEHPRAGSFDPNSMLGAPPANPLTGIAMIAPPSPSANGDAALSFPIEVPPGRRGLTPNVTLSYDSSAGNGWVGVGWNVASSAVTIDTRWGVPRYDPANETEAYTIDGAELSPSPRRGPIVTRDSVTDGDGASAKATFHYRVENFDEVVRHGDSPSSYWWEVRGRDGSRRYYGGLPGTGDGTGRLDNATLRDNDGNVFRWALVEQRDPFGNRIKYTYEARAVAGSETGAYEGRALYLSKIDYTLDAGGLHGPYSITFEREGRPDVILSGRGGFKELVDQRLSRIAVFYGKTLVRSYRLAYAANDVLHKSRLAAVRQFAGSNTDANLEIPFVGNTHTFEYFDDLTNVATGDLDGFGSSVESSLAIDPVNTGTVVPSFIYNALVAAAPNVQAMPTVLGGSRSRGGSMHLYLGFNPVNGSKSPSIGGALDLAFTRSEGLATMVDVDSDGLLDRMYCERGTCFYNRNLGFDAQHRATFEPRRSLEHFGGSFFRENSFSFGGGAQLHAGASLVVSRQRSVARTTRYLSDVNSDGFIDLVSDGAVRFGYLDSAGEVAFSEDSTHTPVPLSVGIGAIEGDALGDVEEEMRSTLPKHDAVRTWTAPFSGDVIVSGRPKLAAGVGPNEALGLDGVFVSIDHAVPSLSQPGLAQLWRVALTPSDPGPIDHAVNVHVERGDFLVFRVNSGVDARLDEVDWAPEIAYVGYPAPMPDENGLDTLRYSAESDFALVGNAATVALPYSGTVRVQGDFSKLGATSDALEFRIVHNGQILYQQPIAADYAGSIAFDQRFTVDVNEDESLPADQIRHAYVRLELVSKTPVDLRAISLSGIGRATYIEAHQPDGTRIETTDPSGQPAIVADVPFGARTFEPVALGMQAPAPVVPYAAVGGSTVRIDNGIDGTLNGLVGLIVSIKSDGELVDQHIITEDDVRLGSVTLTIPGPPPPPPSHGGHDTDAGIEEPGPPKNYYFIVTPSDAWASSTIPTVRFLGGKASEVRVSAYGFAEPRTLTRPYRGFAYGWYQAAPTDGVVTDYRFLFGFNDCVEALRNGSASSSDAEGLRDTLRERGSSEDPETNLAQRPADDAAACSDLPPFEEQPESHRAPLTPELGANCAETPEARIARVTNPDGAPSPFDGEADPFACDGSTGARYVGVDRDIFISATRMGAARVGPNEPPVVGFVGDGTRRGVPRIGVTQARSIGFGAYGASVGHGSSRSRNRIDFEDLNGDGFPDIVAGARAQFTLPNGDIDRGQNVPGIPDSQGARMTGSETWSLGYGASVPGRRGDGGGQEGGSGPSGSSQKSPNGSTLGAVSVSVGGSIGESRNDYDLVDVNGDGLLDRVHPQEGSDDNPDTVRVSLNLGYEFAPAESWGAASDVHASNSIEMNAGIGYTSSNQAWGGGIQASVTRGQLRPPSIAKLAPLGGQISGLFVRGSTLMDIDRDGLADVVRPVAGGLGVHFNLGSGFDPTERVWNGGFVHMPLVNDRVEVSESDNVAVSASGFLSFGVGPLCVGFCYIIINPGAGATENLAHPKVALRDVDGDGALDHVYSNSETKMTVSLNRIGRTGLLRAVHRPLGSAIALDYQRTGNTREMPSSQWSLASVTTFDGTRDAVAGEAVGDHTFTRIHYEAGRYDRLERQFLGFGRVTVEQVDTNGWDGTVANLAGRAIYRTTSTEYLTTGVPTRGLPTRTRAMDGAGNLLSQSDITYQARSPATNSVLTTPDAINAAPSVFLGLHTTVSTNAEPGSSAVFATTQTHDYDAYGNLAAIHDRGGPSLTDDRTIEVSYSSDLATCRANHLLAIPREITVRDASRTLMAHRMATIDCDDGSASSITTSLGSTNAIESLTYDDYGNLAKYEGPPNGSGQKYTVSYGYDTATVSHVTSIGDAYAETASTAYDLRFGIPIAATDANGVVVTTTIDNRGRPLAILGPLERAANAAYTVAFEYHPDAATPYAITRQIDLPRGVGDPIETILFTDATGRELQRKRDATIHAGDGQPPLDAMSISGRVHRDAWGRVVAAWHPTFEAKDVQPLPPPAGGGDVDAGDPPASEPINTTFVAAAEARVPPSRVVYDAFGRARVSTLSDGTSSRMDFAIEPDSASGELVRRARATDALGHIADALTNARGERVGTVEYEGARPIRTTYAFDALSRLVGVRDAAGNVTSVDFDLGGRRTSIVSPDAGRTDCEYDAAGNLVARVTANLRAHGGKIRYGYHYDRLTSVTYPENSDANVTYTYGRATTPNSVGRITRITDRSGTTELAYDVLGRAIRESRTVGGWRPSGQTQTYVTQSSFDTWGRMQQMVYPDGEVLSYRYDAGGLVRSAEGVRLGTHFPYVVAREYDHFGAMVYEQAGNGTISHRGYDPTTRRVARLEAGDFQNVVHGYDAVGQLTDLTNDVSDRRSDRFGGVVQQHFEYDSLSRLVAANGSWNRPEGGIDRYRVSMAYDDIHNITHKQQTHEVMTRGNSHPIEQHETTYNWAYQYESRRPHAPTSIGTATYGYDSNGNQTSRVDSPARQNRRTVWDEESLPREITIAGHTTAFVYDSSGTRVAKSGAQGDTVYVNPTWTVRNGSVATKHIYVGGSRVASKLIPGVSPAVDDPDLVSGMLGRWFEHRSDSGFEHASNTTHNPHYRVDSTMPSGGTPESNFAYFYHGDMSGSVSYVTDHEGELYEHNQFFPSGEQWVAQNSNTERLPFLFTGEELDQETGLYAFGVRMYDPREQTWLTPDPALPMFLAGGLDGSSVFQPRTLSLFSYASNNPVMFEDLTGLNSTSSSCGESVSCANEDGSEIILQSTADVPTPAAASRGSRASQPAQSGPVRPSEVTAPDSSALGAQGPQIGPCNEACQANTSTPPRQLDEIMQTDGEAMSGLFLGPLLALPSIIQGDWRHAIVAAEFGNSVAPAAAMSVAAPRFGLAPRPDFVFRALTSADRASIEAGRGIQAKAPSGTWSATEHVANFSAEVPGGAALNSPWISTTRLPGVAQSYSSGSGIALIDLNRVPSLQVEVWRTAPRVNGAEGLAYHRSIWAQEVTIYQSIPPDAILRVH